jgi:GNAT superfamily N-acetyltransferase
MRSNQTTHGTFCIEPSTFEDIPNIAALMKRSISELQVDVLTPAQIESSHFGMGLDTQLIEDGTYFSVWDRATLVGCGGWSFRATLYGGNHSAGRNEARLNPAKDRARIRAMYTHPEYIRRGIGKMILEASEAAACAAGFSALEMAATLAGEPFYLKCGYTIEDRWQDENGPVPVPLLTMVKCLEPQ